MKKQQKPQKAKEVGVAPLHDKVLLKELKDDTDKTKSGIYLPAGAGADKDTKKGEIVAVGPGRIEQGILVPMQVEVGDVVIYSWGERISVEGVEYTIVKEQDISAIIKS